MKTPTEDRLLNEVLAEGLPAEFSAGLLERTLRAVRRQRRRTLLGRGLAFTAVVALSWFVTSQFRGIRVEPGAAPARRGCEMVRTRPVPSRMMVTSTFASVDVVGSREDSVVSVESAPAGNLFEWLDDAALFAFAGNRPVGLVRLGDESAKLVWPGQTMTFLR